MNDQLKVLADNPALMEAVKAHILEKFNLIPSHQDKEDNLLGQIFRSQLVGRELVESAFRDIERLQTPPVGGGAVASHR